MFEGRVVAIFVASKAGAPMEARDEVKATPGRGIEGDRYFEGTGAWSNHPGEGREITLVEMEAIEGLAREKNVALQCSETRRNLVTRGVPLNHLVGTEFQVGDVRLVGIRLCEPCQYLEEMTTKGVLAGLIHRGGLRANVLTRGVIRVGDSVTEVVKSEELEPAKR
ncbi:MAG TPA: MOSC domain-containing protein [Candidatus Eremiobacteraceae bacterium]|nr:MOSC domain-containing protein [Candidatus Eremiobacteraceae bacterium]